MMTGLVPVSTMEDDFYIFDATKSRLLGRSSGRVLKAGDQLRVQVARVDPFKQQIDFKLAEEPGATRRPKTGQRRSRR
jgi:ribonuclease R